MQLTADRAGIGRRAFAQKDSNSSKGEGVMEPIFVYVDLEGSPTRVGKLWPH